MTKNIAIRSKITQQKDRKGLGPRREHEGRKKKTKNSEKLIRLPTNQEESKKMLMRYKEQ